MNEIEFKELNNNFFIDNDFILFIYGLIGGISIMVFYLIINFIMVI